MKNKNIDFINLLISIGTLCAVFVSYMTLKELREGRSLAILPDFFIVNNSSIDFIADSTILLNPYFSGYNFVDNGDTVSDVRIPIRNLGYGPAKYVEVQWEYDLKLLDDKLKRTFGPDKLVDFKKENYGLDIVEYSISGPVDTVTTFSFRNQNVHFLAPSLEKNIDNYIIVPEDLVLYKMYSQALSAKHNKLLKNLHVKLKVAYLDLSGKRHKKEFLVVLDNTFNRTKMSFEFEEINNTSLELNRDKLGKCIWLDFDGFILEDNYLTKDEISDKLYKVKPKIRNLCDGTLKEISEIRFVIVPIDADARFSMESICWSEDLHEPGTLIYIENITIKGENYDLKNIGGMYFKVH